VLNACMGELRGVWDVCGEHETSGIELAGPAAQLAKEVTDAAQGGMILMSSSCFQRLNTDKLTGTTIVVDEGKHSMSDLGALHLYQVRMSGL
jgi:class 3 adenylate cyclase